MTTPGLTTRRPAHPFAADAAAWGLGEDNLAVIQTEGAALFLLLGSLGAAGGGSRDGALLASFQLDATGLPGIGARALFAGQFRLGFLGGTVAKAEVLRLEWRSPTTLFAEVPSSSGPTGAPAYDGEPGRVARLLAAWARGPDAAAALAAAARAGVRSATRAAAAAKDAASRNARAARGREVSPTARAHHLWWAAKREDEAERQLALGLRLRSLQAELSAMSDAAARRA